MATEADAATERDTASSGLIGKAAFAAAAGACLLTILSVLVKSEDIAHIAIGCLLVYIVLQFNRILPSLRIVAIGLGIVGIVLMYTGGDLVGGFWAAGNGTMLFFVMFSSVTGMQFPALHSPSMSVVRDILLRLPAGKRYIWLSISSHILCAITNFAGFTLLAAFVVAKARGEVKRRMTLALGRGFVAASTWSPFFLAFAVVITVKPGLNWLDLALPGILLAALILAYGYYFDRFTKLPTVAADEEDIPPASGASATPDDPAAPSEGARLRALITLGTLAAILIAAVAIVGEVSPYPMPVVIALVVIPFSLGWFVLIRIMGKDRIDGASFGWSRYGENLSRSVLSLRDMSLLFVGANMFGQGVSATLDGETIVRAAADFGLAGAGWIPFLLMLFGIGSAIGIHAVVMIVVLGHTLPIDSIGISQVTLALIMLSAWGIGGVLSPFSTLTLYVAHILRRPAWSVAWKDQGIYSVGALTLSAIVITAYHYLTV